jgi:hypothetical protein
MVTLLMITVPTTARTINTRAVHTPVKEAAGASLIISLSLVVVFDDDTAATIKTTKTRT